MDQQTAYRTVFNAHFQGVFAFCRKMIQSDPDAEEIALTVFQNAFALFDISKPADQVRAYLFTSARNRCLNFLKAKDVQDRRVKQFAALMTDQDWFEFEYEIRQPVLEALAAAIERLPDRQRQVFKLVYYDGLSLSEAGRLLGLSYDTVRTQRDRAIEKIRTALLIKTPTP